MEHRVPPRASPSFQHRSLKECSGRTARMPQKVKGFGRRPIATVEARCRGRRPKASQGGNRGKEEARFGWAGPMGILGSRRGSPMWRRGCKAAGVIVRSEHDALFRGRGCERRVWARRLERVCGGREDIAFLLRRARGGEGDKHSAGRQIIQRLTRPNSSEPSAESEPLYLV